MDHLKRIKQLQKLLSEWNVEGCVVENPVDLYYLTGFEISLGVLVIFQRGFRIFLDGRYLEMVRSSSDIPCDPPEKLEAYLKGKKTVAFDPDTTSYARFLKLKKWKCPLKPISGLVKTLRAIKTSEEVALLKKSGRLATKSVEFAKGLLKPGVTEKQIARKFEIFSLEEGAERLAFDPIIAFGKNTAFPHYRPGDVVLKKGDLVLIDAGVVIGHYRSDMTRMVFFGKEDPQLKKMYDTIRSAYDAALLLCKPGTLVGKLDEVAQNVIRAAGLGDLIAHGLGHGVGLEVHEFPRVRVQGEDRKVVLQEGMVITIEPGLYLPGKGGVRYENTIIITEDGYEVAL